MSRISAEFLLKFWTLETPSGTVNGSNTVFTLAFTPVENDAVTVFLNGLFQRPTTDYSISGTTITFVTAPPVASDVRTSYIRKTGES
jgi:hypothetical protein